ncbi:hypothetical protein [Bacillus thuringiensis]|uniref:hypothetical protein n=1 Tax=Bacillus thuringiensis TaxID=1428 RepID=UPI000BFCA56F|nr:hypothetical protein [Bacillus thuringiensis]PGS67608.1 hypothetical protein COD07_19265 [Bacillus thuringiensis]
MNIKSALIQSTNSWLQPLYVKMYSHHLEQSEDGFEVHAQQTPSTLTKTLILNVLVSEEFKQVHIPNIFIPQDNRKQGIGFGLINEMLKITESYGYELYIVDMTYSFYNRLLNKGAIPAGDDAVKIDTSTKLLIHSL